MIDNVKFVAQIVDYKTVANMNFFKNITRERKITVLTLGFCLLFIILVGTSEFKNNYLNYSTALSFTGSFLLLKSLIYTIVTSEAQLKINNWFSFGLNIVFNASQAWLLIQGIRYLNQTSDPFNCIWYFFLATVLFFVQIYIFKFLPFFKTALFEIFVFGVCAGALRLMNTYTPENQTYLLLQVFFGYTSFFVACFTYFNLLKLLFTK